MVSNIQVGILLPGHTMKADGQCGSFLGNVALSNDSRVPVYIKCNPLKIVTIELFASKLLEQLGLDTPIPYLVLCPKPLIPQESLKVMQFLPGCKITIGETDYYWGFGTQKVPLPSIKQTIKQGGSYPPELIQSSVNLFSENCVNYPSIIGFDEWIANGDRNLGNLLWDGQKKFYLIDHGLAMDEGYFSHNGNILLDLILKYLHPSTQKISSIFKRGHAFINNIREQDIDIAAQSLIDLNEPEISKNVLSLSGLVKKRIESSKTSLLMRKPKSYTAELFNVKVN